MAVSIKTVQRSPSSEGFSDVRASGPNSLIGIPIRAACSSTKEPVPAAQILFIWKSATSPSFREINLESWPPISKTVSACGFQWTAAFACAVISSRIASAPIILPIRSRPEPVMPTAVNFTSPKRSRMLASPFLTTPSGLPAVRRYWKSMMFPCLSVRTRSVLVEPMSIPSAQPSSGITPVTSGSSRQVPLARTSFGRRDFCICFLSSARKRASESSPQLKSICSRYFTSVSAFSRLHLPSEPRRPSA